MTDENTKLLGDNTEIPEAARCTSDLDFVLLIAPTGYTSQLVKLAAVEKGANWKMYECDFRTLTMYEPWHQKINHRYDFPTLLHGDDQASIVDELVVFQAIDEKFAGKVKLQQACIDDAEIQGRFDKLIAAHYEATWKTYEMQTMLQDIWVARWLGPMLFTKTMQTAKDKVIDKT